jgi:hypothetical protein
MSCWVKKSEVKKTESNIEKKMEELSLVNDPDGSADKRVEYKHHDPYYSSDQKSRSTRGDVYDVVTKKLICHTNVAEEKSVDDLRVENFLTNSQSSSSSSSSGQSKFVLSEYKFRNSFELVGARVFFHKKLGNKVTPEVYSNKGKNLFDCYVSNNQYSLGDQLVLEMHHIMSTFKPTQKLCEKYKSKALFSFFCNTFLEDKYIYSFALPTTKDTRFVSNPSNGYKGLRLTAVYDAETFQQLFVEDQLIFTLKGEEYKEGKFYGKSFFLSDVLEIPTYKTYSDFDELDKDINSLDFHLYQGMMACHMKEEKETNTKSSDNKQEKKKEEKVESKEEKITVKIFEQQKDTLKYLEFTSTNTHPPVCDHMINIFSTSYHSRITLRRQFKDPFVLAVSLIRNLFVQDEKKPEEAKVCLENISLMKSFDLSVYTEVYNKVNEANLTITRYVNDRLAKKQASFIPQTMFFVAQDLMTSLANEGKKHVDVTNTAEFLFKTYVPRTLPIDFFIRHMIYDTLSAKKY